jgi:hypothetical protein
VNWGSFSPESVIEYAYKATKLIAIWGMFHCRGVVKWVKMANVGAQSALWAIVRMIHA